MIRGPEKNGRRERPNQWKDGEGPAEERSAGLEE
jgi:hypothetical protein